MIRKEAIGGTALCLVVACFLPARADKPSCKYTIAAATWQDAAGFCLQRSFTNSSMCTARLRDKYFASFLLLSDDPKRKGDVNQLDFGVADRPGLFPWPWPDCKPWKRALEGAHCFTSPAQCFERLCGNGRRTLHGCKARRFAPAAALQHSIRILETPESTFGPSVQVRGDGGTGAVVEPSPAAQLSTVPVSVDDVSAALVNDSTSASKSALRSTSASTHGSTAMNDRGKTDERRQNITFGDRVKVVFRSFLSEVFEALDWLKWWIVLSVVVGLLLERSRWRKRMSEKKDRASTSGDEANELRSTGGSRNTEDDLEARAPAQGETPAASVEGGARPAPSDNSAISGGAPDAQQGDGEDANTDASPNPVGPAASSPTGPANQEHARTSTASEAADADELELVAKASTPEPAAEAAVSEAAVSETAVSEAPATTDDPVAEGLMPAEDGPSAAAASAASPVASGGPPPFLQCDSPSAGRVHNVARESRTGGRFYLMGASRRGLSHIESNRDREDAFGLVGSGEVEPSAVGWCAIAVADGVGSAPRAKVGSTTAVEKTLEGLRAAMAEPPPTGDCCRIVQEVCWQARLQIARVAQELGCADKDLATTLLVAVLVEVPNGTAHLTTFQAGNGWITTSSGAGDLEIWYDPGDEDVEGAIHDFTSPHVASTFKDQRILHKELDPTTRCIALMSDGITDDLLPLRVNGSTFAEALAKIAPVEGAAETLLELIAYKKRGSGDDRTIACMVRGVS